jgi:radical SAM protein with 4Fe4S-binding SPASM domain
VLVNMGTDNDYFTSYQHHSPFPAVEPYMGKHAVKSASFFGIVRKMQDDQMPFDWVYRPLKVEIELTNGCNESCPHCGMSAQPISQSTLLPRDFLLSIPSQLNALGIPGISITGGEPFTAMPNLLDLLSECRDKVDVVKITTNGYWADSLDAAKAKLTLLADNGFIESRLFRPVLMLSIGEQHVPLERIVNVIVAAKALFRNNELALCISSLSLQSGDERISDLEGSYKEITGNPFPWDSVYLTKRSYIAAGRARLDTRLPKRTIQLEKMCKDRGCFRQTIGAFVVPTPLIKVNGTVYSCSVFGMPDELILGNVYENSIKEIIEAANNNFYIRILAEGNLPALRKIVSCPDSRFGDVAVDNFHEACWCLIAAHREQCQINTNT